MKQQQQKTPKKGKKKENTLYLKNKLEGKLDINFLLIVTPICSNHGSLMPYWQPVMHFPVQAKDLTKY